MNHLTIQQWGALKTVASKTKPMPKEFSRPWQKDIEINPTTCPFDRMNLQEGLARQEVLGVHNDGEEQWRLIVSRDAPERPHFLIIPEKCWSKEKLRVLGGNKKIAAAIVLANSILDLHGMADSQFSVQVGAYAGQNLAHLHYHFYKNINCGDSQRAAADSGAGCVSTHLRTTITPALHVFEQNGFLIAAGGHRTGQCLIIPTDPKSTCDFDENFSEILDRLVRLYTEKFRSVESLAPDYMFEVSIRRRKVAFGIFVPILNQIGTMEYMALFTPEEKGWNLRWSHEATAQYLRA